MRIVLFCLALLCADYSFAAVELVLVEVSAEGGSKSVAVKAALVEAIAQVNGRGVESETLLKVLESSTIEGQAEDYLSSSQYQSAVKTQTKGVVDSYHIIDAAVQGDGSWQVQLQVTVARFKQRRSAMRKSIVVLSPRVKKTYPLKGQSVTGAWVAIEFAQALNNNLVQTRKFTVVDRAFNVDSRAELARASSANVAPVQLAKLGQELVADYVLVGSLDALIAVDSAATMASGFNKYRADLSYRLIDSATQQLVLSHSESVSLSRSEKISSGQKSDVRLLLQRAAKQQARGILNQIYPIAIVSAVDRAVVLGQGGSLLKKGERYNVYEYAGTVRDVYTKESLGKREVFCCIVTVTQVHPKQAYGELDTMVPGSADKALKKRLVLRERLPRAVLNTQLRNFGEPVDGELPDDNNSNNDW